MKRTLVIYSAMSIAVFGSSACELNLFHADDVVSRSFPSGITRVTVEADTADIAVATGAGSAVGVDVTRRAGGNTQQDAQANLENIEITTTVDGETLHVVVRQDAPWGGSTDVSAALGVPDGTTLDLNVATGAVTVTGAAGDVIAETDTGAIDVRGGVGTMTLTTNTGQINASGGEGPLSLTTINGAITIASERGIVAARSSNGAITYGGALAAGSHSYETTNGAIALTLPRDAAFNVDAEATNGSITTEFPVAGTSAGSRLHGSVGASPTSSIALQAANGDIAIRQGP